MGYGRSRDSTASPLQKRLYRLLEPAGNMAQTAAGDSGSPPSPAELRLSRILDVLLVALIVASSAAVVLFTMPDLPRALGRFLAYSQLAATVAFSVEYVARLYAIPASGFPEYQRPVLGRVRYALTPMELVDLAAIAPSYILLFTGSDAAAAALLLRLLRLLKLFRYSDSLMVFARVFREKAGQLTASFFVTGILLVLASGVVYYCERGAQPEEFGSIPTTMWWGIVTLTTVGYGDVSPVTPVGQLFGAITAVIGIGLVALPSGILAGGFIEAFAEGRSQDESGGESGSGQTREDGEPATGRCPHCGEPL